MKVFISWSTDTSRSVASALKEFLQHITPTWEPWVSHQDIGAGAKWREELVRALTSARFAILCVSHRTLRSPWVLFEAGALSALLKPGGMCPYLIGTTTSEIQGPLSDFQSRQANKEGTWDLLMALRTALPGANLSDRVLKNRFERHWPELDSRISEAHLQSGLAFLEPEYNRLDETGFTNLLRIHFAATAARLSYVIEQAVDEWQHDGQLNLDLLMINAKRVVNEGRHLLAPFYSDLVGDISSFLDQCLPPQELEERLKRGIGITTKFEDKSKVRRAAYQLIQDDQAQLLGMIQARLTKLYGLPRKRKRFPHDDEVSSSWAAFMAVAWSWFARRVESLWSFSNQDQ